MPTLPNNALAIIAASIGSFVTAGTMATVIYVYPPAVPPPVQVVEQATFDNEALATAIVDKMTEADNLKTTQQRAKINAAWCSRMPELASCRQ